ncbi:MAG: cation transporter [Clostridia bacterium]
MTTTMKVPSMSCQHCENAVKNALKDLPGVKSVVVNLGAKTVTVEHAETQTVEGMKKLLDDIGYEAE